MLTYIGIVYLLCALVMATLLSGPKSRVLHTVVLAAGWPITLVLTYLALKMDKN